jgi:hypothetical protein
MLAYAHHAHRDHPPSAPPVPPCIATATAPPPPRLVLGCGCIFRAGGTGRIEGTQRADTRRCTLQIKSKTHLPARPTHRHALGCWRAQQPPVQPPGSCAGCRVQFGTGAVGAARWRAVREEALEPVPRGPAGGVHAAAHVAVLIPSLLWPLPVPVASVWALAAAPMTPTNLGGSPDDPGEIDGVGGKGWSAGWAWVAPVCTTRPPTLPACSATRARAFQLPHARNLRTWPVHAGPASPQLLTSPRATGQRGAWRCEWGAPPAAQAPRRRPRPRPLDAARPLDDTPDRSTAGRPIRLRRQ